jgi:hypothetical protein
MLGLKISRYCMYVSHHITNVEFGLHSVVSAEKSRLLTIRLSYFGFNTYSSVIFGTYGVRELL